MNYNAPYMKEAEFGFLLMLEHDLFASHEENFNLLKLLCMRHELKSENYENAAAIEKIEYPFKSSYDKDEIINKHLNVLGHNYFHDSLYKDRPYYTLMVNFVF